MRTVLALALTTLVLGACGASVGEDPEPHPDVTAAGSRVALVPESEADLVLIVSNQSFDDEEVLLSVAIDGVTGVDGDFHVGDQHTWVRYPLALPAGAHELVAESDSGATLRESFEVPGDAPRCAIVEHWTRDDSEETDDPPADLTWLFQREAPAFA